MTSQGTETDLSRTQADRNERSRKLLLDTTHHIIAEEGYRAVTVARIQDASGLSRGLIGYYFGSKEGLILALIDRIRETFIETYHPIRESTDGFTGVAAVFDLYICRLQLDASPAFVMMLLAADSARNDDTAVSQRMKSAFSHFRDLFVSLLEKGQQDGSVDKNISTGPVSVLLESMIRGIVLQYLVDPGEIDLGSVRHETVSQLRRMLSPQ